MSGAVTSWRGAELKAQGQLYLNREMKKWNGKWVDIRPNFACCQETSEIDLIQNILK
jgi:hypothetical protein